MGTLDIKIGELLAQGRGLGEAVMALNESTKLDHDQLVILKVTIEEDRKTLYKRIEDLKDEVRRGEEFRNGEIKMFLEAQRKKDEVEAAIKLKASDLREKKQERAEDSKRNMVKGVVVKVVGWALALAGAYIMARLGIGHKG